MAMTSAEKIIGKFGGVRPTAKILKMPISTVQSWKNAGHIPGKHQPYVMHVAQRCGIALRAADFFNGGAV